MLLLHGILLQTLENCHPLHSRPWKGPGGGDTTSFVRLTHSFHFTSSKQAWQSQVCYLAPSYLTSFSCSWQALVCWKRGSAPPSSLLMQSTASFRMWSPGSHKGLQHEGDWGGGWHLMMMMMMIFMEAVHCQPAHISSTRWKGHRERMNVGGMCFSWLAFLFSKGLLKGVATAFEEQFRPACCYAGEDYCCNQYPFEVM